jgi:hypothetical protein
LAGGYGTNNDTNSLSQPTTLPQVIEKSGGADGIRTHDLLDAIEARSQLRHGPTVRHFYFTTFVDARIRAEIAICVSPRGSLPLKAHVTVLLNLLFFFHTPAEILILSV